MILNSYLIMHQCMRICMLQLQVTQIYKIYSGLQKGAISKFGATPKAPVTFNGLYFYIINTVLSCIIFFFHWYHLFLMRTSCNKFNNAINRDVCSAQGKPIILQCALKWITNWKGMTQYDRHVDLGELGALGKQIRLLSG